MSANLEPRAPAAAAFRQNARASLTHFVCPDCGARGEREGDCAGCGEGPVVDAARPEIRAWLLDEDRRRRDERSTKLLWVAIVLVVGLAWGGALLGPPTMFALLLSIQGVVTLLGASAGVWWVLRRAFPVKDRFGALRER